MHLVNVWLDWSLGNFLANIAIETKQDMGFHFDSCCLTDWFHDISGDFSLPGNPIKSSVLQVEAKS